MRASAASELKFSGNLALVTLLDPRGEFVVRDLHLRQKASELHNTFRALLAGTRQVGVLDSVEPLPTFDKRNGCYALHAGRQDRKYK